MISEVHVHPSTSQLLIKTADDSTEAILHILDSDGTPLNEISVESSEIEIQWNASDASQVLLTAFSEDWSYQMMRYDANEDTLVGVDIADPFAQWIGVDELVYMEDATLLKESLSTGEKIPLASNVSQFSIVGDQAVVEIFDEARIRYTVVDGRGEQETTWLAEDSSLLMESAALIDEQTIAMSVADQTTDASFLVKVHNGEEVARYELHEGGPLKCKGEKCLIGYSFDTWMDIETGKTVKWLATENTEDEK